MQKILGLAVALALAGCVSAGTAVDPSKVAQFRQNKTTYDDVVAALGTPNSVSHLQDGSMVAAYAYVHSAARPQSFIPIVGPLVAKADANTETYTFTFGADGTLKAETSNASRATAGFDFAR